MLRAGKLSNISFNRLIDSIDQQGWKHIRQAQPVEKINDIASEILIGDLRYANKRELRGNWLPAHIAYSAPDHSALLRTMNLMGLKNTPATQLAGFRSVRELKSAAPNFTSQKLKTTKAPSISDYRQLAKHSLDEYENFVMPKRWGFKDYWAPSYNYNRTEATMLIPGFGHPITRHEIGHFAQTGLAYNNPTALNTRTIKTFKDIYKASPRTAMDALHDATTGSELQGHALASRAGRGGDKLRAATSPVGPYPLPKEDPGYAQLIELAKHPTMVKNPSSLSTLEHLYRNYDAPLGPI